MKRLGKLLCFIVVFVAVMAAFCTVGFAATVGQQLTDHESGWQRINDTSTNILYENFSNVHANQSGAYNNDLSFSTKPNGKIKFKFKGTKLRIISQASPNRATSQTITIDGISETYTEKISNLQNMTLVYEKLSLPDSFHSVTIQSGSDGSYLISLDAIDIDSTGYLVDYNSPTNLIAQPGNTKVDLTWNAVEGASGYNIYRSTTSGTGYVKIGSNTTSSAITYEDKPLSNGTTYYYIVTAIVNGVESSPSNEASVTPTAPVVTGNPGILEITMNNGQIKEYDLSSSEIQSFLSWYDGRSNGDDKAYFIITKKNNIKPFLSRKEYIAYDKISSFEVKEYTE